MCIHSLAALQVEHKVSHTLCITPRNSEKKFQDYTITKLLSVNSHIPQDYFKFLFSGTLFKQIFNRGKFFAVKSCIDWCVYAFLYQNLRFVMSHTPLHV